MLCVMMVIVTKTHCDSPFDPTKETPPPEPSPNEWRFIIPIIRTIFLESTPFISSILTSPYRSKHYIVRIKLQISLMLSLRDTLSLTQTKETNCKLTLIFLLLIKPIWAMDNIFLTNMKINASNLTSTLYICYNILDTIQRNNEKIVNNKKE